MDGYLEKYSTGQLPLPAAVLDPQTLARMHETAVAIIGRTGIRIEHADIRESIARRNGFRLVDGRILVDAARVEAWRQCIGPMPADGEPTPQQAPLGFLCGVDGRPTYIVDDDARTVRPMTRRDVIEGTKLIDVLHARGVTGSTPGMPADVPLALQPIEQFMIGAEFSREGGASWACDLPTAKIFREMNRVYGRASSSFSVWSPSGLMLGGPELDILWHFRQEARRVSVGSMPMMGLTGPCDYIAVFTLALAEALGAAAILHELLPDATIYVGPHPEPADLRTGIMIFGSPEWDVLDLMHQDVYACYGQCHRKLLLTSSSIPDAQAIAEHAISATNGMVRGCRRFSPVGQLGLDEVYSPAMLMLDLEILSHAYHATRRPTENTLLDMARLPDLVDETIRQGMIFAEHPTTIEMMRGRYHEPALMRRMNRSQWQAAGCPDIVLDAQAQARRLTAQFNYEPPQDILRELRVIYDKARNSLCQLV